MPGQQRLWTGNEEPRLDELLADSTMTPLLRLWRLEVESVRREMRKAAARLRTNRYNDAA